MGKSEGEWIGALCDQGTGTGSPAWPPRSPHGTQIGIQK